MLTPSPDMYKDWKDWARQIAMILDRLEVQIKEIRAALDLDAGGPS